VPELKLLRAFAGVDLAEDKLGLLIIRMRLQPKRTCILYSTLDQLPGGCGCNSFRAEVRVHFSGHLAVIEEPARNVGHGVFYTQTVPIN